MALAQTRNCPHCQEDSVCIVCSAGAMAEQILRESCLTQKQLVLTVGRRVMDALSPEQRVALESWAREVNCRIDVAP